MRKFYKIISCMLLILSMIMQFGSKNIKAQETKLIDQFLLEIGMSQDIIDVLPEGQKQIMYEHLDKNARFSSYTVEHISFDETGNATTARNISDSDLTITLATAKTQIDGKAAYAFFPSFSWNKVTAIKNDSFSFALYPGWEIVAFEDSNLEVWLRNQYGDKQNSASCPVTSADDRSMSFKFNDIGALAIFFEGHAVFYAKDSTGNATPSMYIHYFQDNTFSRNLNYGIALPSLSIAFSSSNNYEQKLVNLPFKK